MIRVSEHHKKLIHAYNVMPHAGTGCTPFFMMFGSEEKTTVNNDKLQRLSNKTKSNIQ